jgi:predicted transcriptional regulator with HTH domain
MININKLKVIKFQIYLGNIVPYEAMLSEIYQNVAADCNEMCD